MRTYVHLKRVWKIKVNKHNFRRVCYIFYTFQLRIYNYLSTDIQIDCSVDAETEPTIYCTTFTVIILMKLLYSLKNKQSFAYQCNGNKVS